MRPTILLESLSPLLGWLALLSLVTFIASLLLIPLLVSRMPVDVFVHMRKHDTSKNKLSLKFLLLYLARNILALVLLAAGFIMLFIPGQGLLTILLGLLLLSFPGKRRLILIIVRQEKIQKSLNWLRIKQKKEPFLWPEQSPV